MQPVRAVVTASAVFAAASFGALAQEPSPGAQPGSAGALAVGSSRGLPRPEGFVVEDRRAPEQRTASDFRQTYKAPPPMPFRPQPVPLAKYQRRIGEAELSAPPVDLLVDKLVEHYGDKLKGQRLVVHEFSYALEQVVNKPQGMVVIPLDAASLGIALLGSVAGTALMQGRGIDVKLSARIDAELGDHRVETTVLPVSVERADAANGLTRDALENFVYQLDNAMAAAAPPSKD